MNKYVLCLSGLLLCLTFSLPVMAGDSNTEESVVVKPAASLDDSAPSLSAKFGSGLTVKTANESFSFQIRGRFQSLIQVEHYYDSDAKAEFGAQVRRARLKLAGHVGRGISEDGEAVSSKHRMKYSVQLGFTNRDISDIAEGKGVLLDAYLTYSPCKKLDIIFGQTKLPGNREFMTSSQKQQFVDRGVTSGFRLDRAFGLQFRGKFGDKFIFKPMVAISTGEGRNVTGLSTSGLDFTFRTDFLPLGDFKKGKGDYVLADVDREPKAKLAIGGAYDLNHNALYERGQRGGDEIDPADRTTIHTVFADLLFKCQGFSIFGEIAHRTVGEMYRSSYSTGNAYTAQAGYVTKKHFEVAARYGRTNPLDNLSMDKDMKVGANNYTLAVSKYFMGHNLKIQTDYTMTQLVNGDPVYGLWRFQVEVAF